MRFDGQFEIPKRSEAFQIGCNRRVMEARTIPLLEGVQTT
jgi:hypothetical protein